MWVLPVALAGQCLLIAVYSELASEFPMAGGPYQWTRRLMGGAYGWFTGWVAICAYLVANTTIAYLGAPWALTLLDLEPTANAVVVPGMGIVVVCALAGAFGIGLLSRAVTAGITAEIVATVGVGLALLLAFREQDLSLLGDTLGAEALSGGSVGAGLLAALAVGGWVFIGFDACVAASEETRDAGHHVPRAIWTVLLGVGVLVFVNAVAVSLAHPDPAAVVAGGDPDPVGPAVVESFGSWSTKPFAAVVLIAFVACGIAARRSPRARCSPSRATASCPASRLLRSVDRRRSPIGATVVTAVVAFLGLLLGLNSAAVRASSPSGPPPSTSPSCSSPWRRSSRASAGRGSRRERAARPGRARGQRPGRGLAGVRDRQHRLAALLAGAARRAGVPGVGGAARARAHHHGGPGLPRAGAAPPADQGRVGKR